jgi:ankyrin repeat protein
VNFLSTSKNKKRRASNDDKDDKALHALIRQNDMEGVVKLLSIHGTALAQRADASGTLPLHLAVDLDAIRMCQVLIEQGGADLLAKNERFGWTLLHLAAYKGHDDIATMLVDREHRLVDELNLTGNSPLHFAALNGRRQCVRLLLEQGADVNLADDDGDTPLHMAAVNGHVSVIEALVDAGAQVQRNKANQTPLMLAHEAGHRHLVEAQFCKSS